MYQAALGPAARVVGEDTSKSRRSAEVLGRHLHPDLCALPGPGSSSHWMDSLQYLWELDQPDLGHLISLLLCEVVAPDQEVE